MVQSIKKPPPAIHWNRVLYYAVLGKSIRYSGCKLLFVGRAGEELKEVKKVPCVAICEGESDSKRTFLLFYCDKDWNVIATCPIDSTEAAKRRAERMYPGISKVWVEANVTKKQARDYLNELWKHSRCHFCDQVKPGPAEIKQLIKTKEGFAICNHCVDTLYRSIHAKKERKS